MKKILIVLAMMVALLGSNANAEDKIEMDPGLYAYSTVVNVGGRIMPQEPFEYCLFDGINSRSFEELVTEISGDGDCDVTNAQIGSGQARADVSCPMTDLGFAMTGKVTGKYTATSYSVTTNARPSAGGPEVTVKTTAKRLMDCPENWTAPEGISHK